MSVLILGTHEQAAIDDAIARARRRPVSLATLKALSFKPQDARHLKLADRPPNFKRPQSEIVLIPIHYRLQISFEEHLPGMCLHISISLLHRAKEALPSIPAVLMIAKACGIAIELDQDGKPLPNERLLKGWIEDFEDAGVFAGRALNFLYLMAPMQAGHA